MRVHISVDDSLVAELDRRVGPRGRSPFIAAALAQALDDERRWDAIIAAAGAMPDSGREWEIDAADWVRSQRWSDGSRVG